MKTIGEILGEKYTDQYVGSYAVLNELMRQAVDEAFEYAAKIFDTYDDDDGLEPRYVQDKIRQLKRLGFMTSDLKSLYMFGGK